MSSEMTSHSFRHINSSTHRLLFARPIYLSLYTCTKERWMQLNLLACEIQFESTRDGSMFNLFILVCWLHAYTQLTTQKQPLTTASWGAQLLSATN